MIYGIGTDITAVKRFEKWVKNDSMIDRFFNKQEQMTKGTINAKCEHYAARFAAKEALSKAVGTGLVFDLREVFIVKNEDGKPDFQIQGNAKKIIEERCGDCKIHVSLSHEKEYATAFVIIEKL